MAWTFYSATGEVMIQDGSMSIANNTNNRVVTATGADPASLNGEANLTFDGTDLTVGAGNVIIGTAGKGIDFSNQASPASGMSSELLDRYEEGTFTPSVADNSNDGSGESQSYTVQAGMYTRIGQMVFGRIQVVVDSLGSLTTSEAMKIMGLPFTSRNLHGSTGGGFLLTALGLAIPDNSSVGGFINSNVAYVRMMVSDVTTGSRVLLLSEYSADGNIDICFQYSAA
jgi:hypothetical protein